MPSATKEVVDKLNALLRGEMTAVQTYDKALTAIKTEDVKKALTDLREAHQKRLDELKAKVKEFGGEPSPTTGLWGAFAKMIEDGAVMMGEKSAVGALEEGEVKGLADYKSDLEVFDQDCHHWIFNELLPAQQQSYETIHKLHKEMH